MKKYLNLCNIYILLWCLYYLQGIVYAEGSAISQMILLIIMCISAFYFVYVNRKWKVPPFMRVLNLFIAVMTIYGLALMLDPTPIYADFILSEPLSKSGFLKAIYISLLPVYVMYYCTKRGELSASTIRVITCVLLLSVTLTYFREQEELLRRAIERGSQQEEFTNNTGYQFLALFPLLFFFQRRPIVQYVLMSYIFVFIILGLKRGAIVIGAICLLWFLYRMLQSTQNGRRRWLVVLLTVIVICVGGKYLLDFYETSEYFQRRVEDTLMGNSSGRDTLYARLWTYYQQETTFGQFFFGNGAMSTIRLVGNYAHNDWLELLICQGLLGAGIYALYFISLFVQFLSFRRKDSVCYNILGMLLLIMFVSSVFSMSYNSLSLSVAICLGYCMAHQENKGEIQTGVL